MTSQQATPSHEETPKEDPSVDLSVPASNSQQITSTLTWSRTHQSRRPLCSRCQRPIPSACICEALPSKPFQLTRTRFLVLQHPAELKRKNRSIPVLQLSVHPDSFLVALGRRLGDKISPELMAIVRDNTEPLLLLFPGPEAIGLDEALEKFQARDEDKRINVLVLDATWKYVREMDRANAPYYPPHMIRVQLKPTDDVPNFSPGRFDIRTPPSQDHLSTAECMAWVASRVERDESLYESLLAPLDYMVAKWKSFSEQEEDKRRHNNNDEDDNKPSTSSPDRQRGSKRKKAVNIENTRCNDILN